MLRERKIDHLSPIMSRRAHRAAQNKFGIKIEDLAGQYKQLGEAGGKSDFHDNPAFDEANRLIDVMGISVETWRLAVMNPQFIEPQRQTKTVQVGSTVDIQLVTFDDRFKVNLLGAIDAILFSEDSISYESPLGRAILGKPRGAEIEYEADDRKLKAKIIKILPGNF